MKVLIVTPYYAPIPGGLEHYAQQLARGLQAEGWQVAVATSGRRTGRDLIDGIPVYRLRRWLTIGNTPVSPLWHWQLRALRRKLQPDVFSVHAPVPSLALAMLGAAGRVPVVITYHAGSMKKGRRLPDALIWVYENLFLPQMLKRATALIAASEFVGHTTLSKFAQKTTIVTPGVDCIRFQPASPLPIPAKNVLFVGDSRDARKGLSVLLSALELVPEVHLTVVGPQTAPEPNQPKRAIAWTGPLSGKELVQTFQSADVLVLPSTTDAESFGMVLIEAMACGLPVIASRVGGIPDVLSTPMPVGELVPPNDPVALAAAIQSLLENPERAQRYGKNGRAHVLAHYAWETRAASTSAVLAQAAESSRADLREALPHMSDVPVSTPESAGELP